MRQVSLRAKGITRNAVLAPIGQPMAKADYHRISKSFRQPILENVTAPLTTKTIMAVITTGKMYRALPLLALRPLCMMSPFGCIAVRSAALRLRGSAP